MCSARCVVCIFVCLYVCVCLCMGVCVYVRVHVVCVCGVCVCLCGKRCVVGILQGQVWVCLCVDLFAFQKQSMHAGTAWCIF